MNATNIRHRLNNTLWGRRDNAATRGTRVLLRVLRTIAVIVRDAMQGQLTLRAMGLVYTTLLSIVPLLALSFSVLKAFGVHNQIEPMLQRLLAPLGESSYELTGRIIGFIGNMNVGVLGSVGLALLIYTSVSLIQKIEESLNFIWHAARPRSLGERFSRYLSLLLVGPILVFATFGISASVMNTEIVNRILDIQPFGLLFLGLSRLVPYLLISGAFTFAYHFIPNVRVRLTAALIGGAVAGAAWQSAGWAFAAFVSSSGKYTAIYSGFAVLILFLIWLYVSWLILLIGASIAFYYQHPEYLVARAGEPRLANRERERLALGCMSLVAGNFLAGKPPPDVDRLAEELFMPAHAVQVVLDALADRGLLVQTGSEPIGYLPARDPDSIALGEIVETVRSGDDESAPGIERPSSNTSTGVDEIVLRIDRGVEAALSGLTLKGIAAATGHPGDTSATKSVRTEPA
jgi:membrane protein